MTCLPAFIHQHYGVIMGVSGYIFLTMARQLPQPGTKMTPYEYFYCILHSLLASPVVKSFEARVAPADVVITSTDKTGGSITIK